MNIRAHVYGTLAKFEIRYSLGSDYHQKFKCISELIIKLGQVLNTSPRSFRSIPVHVPSVYGQAIVY
jgi:hypothetical protein